MEIEAVFFDCDGVLVNTEPIHYRAFLRALEKYGITFDYSRYVERYIGFDDRDAFKAIWQDYKLGYPLESEISNLIASKNRAVIEEASKGVETFDGVITLVEKLHKKYPLGVVSGSLRKEVESFLKTLGILEFFKVFVTAEDVTSSKPDPQSYIKAKAVMEDLLGKKIASSSCVVFEDTPAGIKSAKDAGMFVIAITNSFEEKDLKEADIVVKSFNNQHLYKMLGL